MIYSFFKFFKKCFNLKIWMQLIWDSRLIKDSKQQYKEDRGRKTLRKKLILV